MHKPKSAASSALLVEYNQTEIFERNLFCTNTLFQELDLDRNLSTMFWTAFPNMAPRASDRYYKYSTYKPFENKSLEKNEEKRHTKNGACSGWQNRPGEPGKRKVHAPGY